MNPTAAESPTPHVPALPADQTAASPTPIFELSAEDEEILRAASPESVKGRENDCLGWWRELPKLFS